MLPSPSDDQIASRRHWMSVLAKSPAARLEELWRDLAEPPAYRFLRRPEIGLTMIRARAGGTGTVFNLGEMTMTRCAVETATGHVGFGHVAGRDTRHAELAALFDALLQDPARHDEISATVLAPLTREQETRREQASRKAAATRVNFFTMAREA
ncbi:phosphonate C-P lyase system protein PhnG [Telmatospirillum sp. J64-1]|uniref:phosphonate C-P lyase system protein PhnG n=1 Tax=Telmatospirillum sp. J64-1 TaxID=2502183 RepID=UPI00115C4822|nr:phosphonate C-P lyase system protein PhnG [Telmatospirillum sp. J64-1]